MARPHRIFAFENDPDVVALLELELRFEGHEIVGIAADGHDAVERCRAAAPDVVLIDYRMPPGPDGLTVAAQLREAQIAAGLILYTNYRDPVMAQRAAELDVPIVPKGDLRVLRHAIADAAPPPS